MDQIIQNICDEKHKFLELETALTFSVKGLRVLNVLQMHVLVQSFQNVYEAKALWDKPIQGNLLKVVWEKL